MLGIDIGSYRMVMAESDNGRIKKTATATLPDNMVRDGRIIAYSAMADFIKETIRRRKLKYRDVVLSISAENYYIRQVDLPLMTTALLDVNLPFEFHDYISGDPERYIYDYAVLSMDDRSMKLMAAALSKDLVNNYRVMMRRAGLRLVKIVPDVLALSSILYHPERIVDTTKSRSELAAMRREVDERVRKERESAERAAKKRELAEKKSERARLKEERALEKSGFILDEDDIAAAANWGDAADSAGSDTLRDNGDSANSGMANNNTSNGNAVNSDNVNSNASNGGISHDDTPEGKDYAILDVGYGNAALHFFSKGTFEITRTMDEGERKIAQYIADEYNMDIHIAMLQIENNQDNILNEQGVLDLFDALATEIMRVMNFYSYNNPKNTIDRIYYFGGGTAMPQLLKAVEQATELPMHPLTDLIPGLTESQKQNLMTGPQAFGAVIE
jgi:Tfp pilus assembly PilM family ATPase